MNLSKFKSDREFAKTRIEFAISAIRGIEDGVCLLDHEKQLLEQAVMLLLSVKGNWKNMTKDIVKNLSATEKKK